MLVPALVPEPLWGLSAAAKLPRSQWQAIRAEALRLGDSRCAHCGTRHDKGLVCHELWDYGEDDFVATLAGFQIVCRDCTSVHHIGRAAKLGFKEQALAHMATVNGTSVEKAVNDADAAYLLWRERSDHGWRIRVDEMLLRAYPQLATIDGLAGNPGDGRRRLDHREIR